MWLFTKHGFYSVVQAKLRGGCVQVRARIKDDLERLRLFARESIGVEMPSVIVTSHADYAYRIIVERSLWTKLAAALAHEIDYTNFKNAVHGEADRDAAYFEVWSAMNGLQWARRRDE